MVSGNSDYTLYKTLRGVPRIAEYYDVAMLDGLNAIDEFIDENALLIVQGRHHAGALNLHWLVQEDDDERRNRERDDQVAHPGRKKVAARLGVRVFSLLTSGVD